MPTKRLGEPEDIANLAVFLASDKASWITGETYVIDGGAGAPVDRADPSPADCRADGAAHLAEGGARDGVDEHQAARARQYGASRSLTAARRSSSVGGSPAGHDERRDDLAPLGVGPADDGDVGDRRVRGQHGLDRLGPHVLAAGDDQVAAPAVDAQPAVGRHAPTSPVANQPSTTGLGAVAVAAQQHRAADVDLAVGVDAHLDAVERARRRRRRRCRSRSCRRW